MLFLFSFGWNPLICWIPSSCSTGTSGMLPACHVVYNQNFQKGSVFIWLLTCCQKSNLFQENCLLTTITAEMRKQFRNKYYLVYIFSPKFQINESLRPNQNRRCYWFNSLLCLCIVLAFLLWVLVCTSKTSMTVFF